MAFKYQVSLALSPKDILLITLNHMDAIRKFIDGQPPIMDQVEHVYQLLLEVSTGITFDYILVKANSKD